MYFLLFSPSIGIISEVRLMLFSVCSYVHLRDVANYSKVVWSKSGIVHISTQRLAGLAALSEITSEEFLGPKMPYNLL